MHVRRRVWGTGAVVFATAGIVLSASPAQADCGGAEPATSEPRWHVGMQLGTAPVGLSGVGGLPGVLLGTLPDSQVAVEDARGHTLVGLNASSRLAETQPPALTDERAADQADAVDLVGPVAAPPAAGPVSAPAPSDAHAVAPAAQPVDRAAAAASPETAPETGSAVGSVAAVEVPLQVPGADSVLGGRYAWVPIEAIGGLGPETGGLPWTGGLALAVLAGGAGAVTVVARLRRTIAG